MILSILLALLPVCLLIALGYGLRARRFLGDDFWRQAEKLAYFVLLPSLFFHGLATADMRGVPLVALVGTLIGATTAVSALVVATRPLTGIDGPAFTSLFQGAVRFNNYVGVTLAAGLFGAKGVALAAICNAALVPLVNFLSILVFARHGAAKLDLKGVVRQIATNPLLVACLAGVLYHLTGLALPPGIEPALKTLGAAALPIGLLCVGAALDFSSASRWVRPVTIASGFKFLAVPLATALLARWLGLDGPALTTALLFACLPTASSAYILARQLGGDAPLMAGITATQTVLGFAAMPAVMAVASLLTG